MSGHKDINDRVIQTQTPTHGDRQPVSALPQLALSKTTLKAKQHQRNPLSSPYFTSLPDRSPKRRVKVVKKGRRKGATVGPDRIETEEPRNRRSTAVAAEIQKEPDSPESPLRLHKKYTAPAARQENSSRPRSLHVRRQVRHKRGSFGASNSSVAAAEHEPLEFVSSPAQRSEQPPQRESKQANGSAAAAAHGTDFVVGAHLSIAQQPDFESRQQQRAMRHARRRRRKNKAATMSMSTREAAPVESIVTHHAHSPFRADGQFSKTPRFSPKNSPLPYQVQVESASKSPATTASAAAASLHVAEQVYSAQSLNDHSTREVALAVPRLRHSQRGQRRGAVQYMRKLLDLKRSEHRAMLFQYACRIQGMYRCWKARRLMEDLKIHAKAVMLQLFFRQRKAYGEMAALKEARRHTCATTIQLMYRRRVAMRETHRRRRIRCATSIQSVFRGWILRRKWWAANELQKVYRGHLARSIVRLWHRAATTVETLCRKMLARKRIERWRTDLDGLLAHALKVYTYCCSSNWTQSRMNEMFDSLQSDVAGQREMWPDLLEYHVVADALEKSTAAVTFNRRLTAQAEDQLRRLCLETPEVVAADQTTTRVVQEQIANILTRASSFGIAADDGIFISSLAALRRFQAGEIAEVATCLGTRIESGDMLDINYVDAVQSCASELNSNEAPVPSFTEALARLSTLQQHTAKAVEDMNLGLLAKVRGLAQVIVTEHKNWHEQQLFKCLPDFHTCVSMWFASVSNLAATASHRGDTYLAAQLKDEVTEMSAFMQAQVPSVDQISIFCDAFLAAIGTELPQENNLGEYQNEEEEEEEEEDGDSGALPSTQFWATHGRVMGDSCQRTPLAEALETRFRHLRRLECRSRVQYAAMFFTSAITKVIGRGSPKLNEISNRGGDVVVDSDDQEHLTSQAAGTLFKTERNSAVLGKVRRLDVRRFVNALQKVARGIQWYDSVDAFEAAQVRTQFLLDNYLSHIDDVPSNVPESKVEKVGDGQATSDEATADIASGRDPVRDGDAKAGSSKFDSLIVVDKLRRSMQEVLLFASPCDDVTIQKSLHRYRAVLASIAQTHEDDKFPQSPFPQLPIDKDATTLHARIVWRLASVVSGHLCIDTHADGSATNNSLPIAIEFMDKVVSGFSLDASRNVHVDCQCARDVFDTIWRRELLFAMTLGILRSQYETAAIGVDSTMTRSALQDSSPFDALSFTSMPKRPFKPGARVFGPMAPCGSLAEGTVQTVAPDGATVVVEFDNCGLTLELPSFLVAATKGEVPTAESHPRRVADFPFATAAVGQRVECMPVFMEDEWLEGVVTGELLSYDSFSVMIASISTCAKFVRAPRLRPSMDVAAAMHAGMWVEFSRQPGEFEVAVVDSFDPKTRSCGVLCEQPGLAVLRQLQVATAMVRPYLKHETIGSKVEVLVDHQQSGDMKWHAATVLQNRVTGLVDVKLDGTTEAAVVEEVPLLRIRPLLRQQGVKLCDVPVGAFVEVAIGESEDDWCSGRIDSVNLESGTCSVRYIREPGGKVLSASLVDAFSKLRVASRVFKAGEQVEVFVDSTWKPASIVDVLEGDALVLKSAVDDEHVVKNRAADDVYKNQSLSVRPALEDDPFSLVWHELELGMVLDAFVPNVNEEASPTWQKIIIHSLDKDTHCVSGMRFAHPLAPSVSVSVRELRVDTSICVVGTEVEALFGGGGNDWLDAQVVDSTPDSLCKLQFLDVDLEEDNVRPIFMRPRLNVGLKERLATIARVPKLDPSSLVPGMDLYFAAGPNSGGGDTAESEPSLRGRFVSASPDGTCVILRVLDPSDGGVEADETTTPVPLSEIRVGPRNFEAGHAVEALVPGDDDHVWHHCIVELHSPDGSFDLLYTDIGDDGEKHEMVPELCVRHILPYKPGEKVQCQRVAGEEWADATIKHSNEDGSFDVELAHGHLEEIRVPAQCLRRPQRSREPLPPHLQGEAILQRKMQTMVMSAVAASINGVHVGVFAADDIACTNFDQIREAIILQVAKVDGQEHAKVEYVDDGVVETVPMTRVVFDEHAVLEKKLDVRDIVVGMELDVTSSKDGSVWSTCEVASVSFDDETCLIRVYDSTSGKDVMRNAGVHELRSSQKHFIVGSVVEAVATNDGVDQWGFAEVENVAADGSYDLLFAATGERTVMAPLYVRCFKKYNLGDEVEIHNAGSTEWSHGVISFVNPDRTFDIQQGSNALSKLQVPPHLIRPVGGVASEGSMSEDELSEGRVESMAISAAMATVTGMHVGVFAADDESLSDLDRVRDASILEVMPEGDGVAKVQYDDDGSTDVVPMDRLLFDENALSSKQLDPADLVPGMELEVVSRADSSEWVLGEVVSVSVEARTCVLEVFDDERGKRVLRTAAMPELRPGDPDFVAGSVVEVIVNEQLTDTHDDCWSVAKVTSVQTEDSFEVCVVDTGEYLVRQPLLVRHLKTYSLRDEVECRRDGGDRWESGMIVAVNPDRTFGVQYDGDGFSQQQVPPNFIRPAGMGDDNVSLSSEDELSEGRVESMAISVVMATVTGMHVGVFAADDESLSDLDRVRDASILEVMPEGDGVAKVQYDDDGSTDVVPMDRLLFDENAVSSKQLDPADLVPGMELEVVSRADSSEWVLGEVVSVSVEARTCVLEVFDDERGKRVLRTAAMPELRVGPKQFGVGSVVEAFEYDDLSSNTWQLARVDAIAEDGSFAIQFIDSGNRVVRDGLLVRHFTAYAVQDQVECWLAGSDRWRAGKISSVNMDMMMMTFDVTFPEQHGESQTHHHNLPPHMIRPLTARSLDESGTDNHTLEGEVEANDFTFDLADFVPGSEWEVVAPPSSGSTRTEWCFAVVEAVDISAGKCTVRVFDTTTGSSSSSSTVDVREVSPSMMRLVPKQVSTGSIVEAFVAAQGEQREEKWVRCLVGRVEEDGLMNLISTETGEQFEEVIPLLVRHVRSYDVGAEVKCRRQAGGGIRWAAGTVNVANADGTFGVVFDDEEYAADAAVAPHWLRPRDADSSGGSLDSIGRLDHQISSSLGAQDVADDTGRLRLDDNGVVDIAEILPGMELELIQDAAPGKQPVMGDVVSTSLDEETCLLMVFDRSVHRTVMRQVHVADLRVGERSFIAGSVVEALPLDGDDNQWEAAVVQDLGPSGSSFSVRFLDTGVPAVLDPLCVRHLKSYELGEEVDYRQELSNQWSSGVIAAVNIDGTFNVERDVDGGLSVALAAHLVRPSNVDGTTMASNDNDSQATEIGSAFLVDASSTSDARDAQNGRGVVVVVPDDFSGKEEKLLMPHAAAAGSSTGAGNASTEEADSEQEVQVGGTPTPHNEVPAGFEVGQRVECRFDGGNEYFDARVTVVEQNGTYNVEYDDGDVEQGVDGSMLRIADVPSDEEDSVGDTDTEAGMSEAPFVEESDPLEQTTVYNAPPVAGQQTPETIAVASVNATEVQDTGNFQQDDDDDDDDDEAEVHAEQHDRDSQGSVGAGRQPLQDEVVEAQKNTATTTSAEQATDSNNTSSAEESADNESVSNTELSHHMGVGVSGAMHDDAQPGKAVHDTMNEPRSSVDDDTSVALVDPDKHDDHESDKESKNDGTASDDVVDDELEAAVFANALQPQEAGPRPGPNQKQHAFSIGQEVECRFDGGADFFEATIAAQNADGTYDVDYEDGDQEEGVEEAMIRAVEEWTDGEEDGEEGEEEEEEGEEEEEEEEEGEEEEEEGEEEEEEEEGEEEEEEFEEEEEEYEDSEDSRSQ